MFHVTIAFICKTSLLLENRDYLASFYVDIDLQKEAIETLKFRVNFAKVRFKRNSL